MDKRVNRSGNKVDQEPLRVFAVLPASLRPFVNQKLAQPRYNGKISNFIRELVADEQERELAQ